MAHQSTEHVPPEYCLHLEHMSSFWAAVSGGMPAVGNTGLPLHSVAGGLSQRTDAVLHAVSAVVVQAVFTPFDVHVPHAVHGYLPVPVLKVEPAAQDGAVPPASTQHWERKGGEGRKEEVEEVEVKGVLD